MVGGEIAPKAIFAREKYPQLAFLLLPKEVRERERERERCKGKEVID
jgi:hypothetical protein